MKRKLVLLTIMIFSLFLIAGCGGKSENSKDAEDQKQIIEEGQPDGADSKGLTSFKTQDIYGAEKNQDIFKDYSLTMVNVWGTFCGPCLEEMPYLGELQQEYEPKGVNIIGIVVDVQDKDLSLLPKQQELAQEIAVTTGAEYTHLIVSEEIISSVLSQFDAIPASFFVDSDGNIVSEFYIGARSKEDWTEIIEKNIGDR